MDGVRRVLPHDLPDLSHELVERSLYPVARSSKPPEYIPDPIAGGLCGNRHDRPHPADPAGRLETDAGAAHVVRDGISLVRFAHSSGTLNRRAGASSQLQRWLAGRDALRAISVDHELLR